MVRRDVVGHESEDRSERLGLQRALGLRSYKTAWTWLHKLRRAMVRPGRNSLTGRIEVDETFVGGVHRGHRGRQTKAKRWSPWRCRSRDDGSGASVCSDPDASAASLVPFVQAAAEPGSFNPYRRLARVRAVAPSSLHA